MLISFKTKGIKLKPRIKLNHNIAIEYGSAIGVTIALSV